MTMPGMPQGQQPQPQQQPAQGGGQRVVIMEDGQPVGEGVMLGIQVQMDGVGEVTITPDSRHQIVPADQAQQGQHPRGQPGPGGI